MVGSGVATPPKSLVDKSRELTLPFIEMGFMIDPKKKRRAGVLFHIKTPFSPLITIGTLPYEFLR